MLSDGVDMANETLHDEQVEDDKEEDDQDVGTSVGDGGGANVPDWMADEDDVDGLWKLISL